MPKLMKAYQILLIPVIICLSSAKEAGKQVKEIPASGQFEWEYALSESQGMSSEKLDELVRDLASRGTKKLLVVRHDKVVCSYFASGYEDSVRGHYTASLAKAIVSGMSLLVAMNDSLIGPDDPACKYIPAWKDETRKSKITIRHLAGHTSGMEDSEVSAEEQEEMRARGLHTHMDLPGWKGMFWRQEPDPFTVARDSAPILSSPGQKYAYSNPGIAMLNYAVTAAIQGTEQKDIRNYLREKIYRPIGVADEEVSIGYGKTYMVDGLPLVAGWGGGGFTANAVARIGRLMLRKGNWEGKQLIDPSLVEEVVRFEPASNWEFEQDLPANLNPFLETTLGWYSNRSGIWEFLPRDAFAGAGAQNQLLLVVPSLDLIVVRFGEQLLGSLKGDSASLGVEQFLFNPVVEAIVEAPCPQSDLIREARFAPAETVLRMAKGSDNWPSTWAGDGHLYTAYGDGNGFLPGTDIKLSLGLCRVEGDPPDLKGVNIRTTSGERVGDGKFGPKASGMLMVDGTLYMLVRNFHNARLAWSEDQGRTWEWADWRFTCGMGCPTFLNFGKNYEGARDRYVYVYSNNEESAYKASDEMILARVAKDRLRQKESYEYFAGHGPDQNPLWSTDYQQRKAVFTNPGKCYRSGITYNAGLKRYLWCQIIPVSDRGTAKGPRFKGGLAIYEAAEPWGPWKTVYYTMDWDMGPGETASLPTKWMSEDGRSCYLLFSGNDCFSLRAVNFITD
jgi:CubicO group peptidase (beta-lactamase class C family)